MRRSAVDVEVVLLYILSMVPFAICQSEQSLFQDRVSTIPKRQREAKSLFLVRDARQTIFSPVIRSRPSLIVTEILPSVSIGTVIFADRAPLSFTEIRTPLSPRHCIRA